MTEVVSMATLTTSTNEDLSSLGKAHVKVLGLGGGGSNAINRMIELGLSGVDFIAANTDAQALLGSLASVRLQLGPRVTRGLGAGGDPKIGAAAAPSRRAATPVSWVTRSANRMPRSHASC